LKFFVFIIILHSKDIQRIIHHAELQEVFKDG